MNMSWEVSHGEVSHGQKQLREVWRVRGVRPRPCREDRGVSFPDICTDNCKKDTQQDVIIYITD